MCYSRGRMQVVLVAFEFHCEYLLVRIISFVANARIYIDLEIINKN